MAENTENTFTSYLGPDFQTKLMWQLLVEPEFAERVIPNLAIEYFDDPNLKRLFIIILEYFKEFQKVPNLQNKSIHLAINKFKTPNNQIEEESLFSVVKRVELWNQRTINKEILHDGEVVQKSTTDFIKQQEWRKFGEFIIEKVKTGEIKRKHVLGDIDDRLLRISQIGDDEDLGTEVTENIERVLRKEFRKTVPTGVNVIDLLTGGGLGRGEIGIVLTPSGVGKTTLLTKIANTAYEQELNVLQIVFEDTVEQIQRKHFTIWSKVALSDIDDNNDFVMRVAYDKAEKMQGKGRLIIKKMSQENTTMMDVRNFITRYQKKFGYKFDLVVLDYLDCLDSHKKTNDRNEAELVIIKSFEAMAADLDIPAWSAIQSNRSGFDAEFVEAYQTGGSIKRVQKAHFFMSVAKTPAQKESGLANVRIIKARFAKDGQTFVDCIFDNDKMEIRFQDENVLNTKVMKNLPKKDEGDVEKLEKLAEKYSSLPMHTAISQKYSDENLIEKVNTEETITEPIITDTVNDTVNDAPTDTVNEGVTEGVSEGVNNDDLLYIDENEVITTDNKNETTEIIETNEGVNEGVNDAPFEWTGETETVIEGEITEVTLDSIPKIEEKIPEIESKTVTIQPVIPKIESNNEKINNIEKLLLNDPDAPSNQHLSLFDTLKKIEENQRVVKKE